MISKRAGSLRKPQHEILLESLVSQSPLLDIWKTLKIEIAARHDDDNRLAFEFALRKVLQRVDGERPGRFQHNTFDVEHLDHRGTEPVFRNQMHGVGRERLQ